MFKVIWNPWRDDKYEVTVYAVDRPTNSFLIIDNYGDFEWVPMSKCRICEEE